MRYRIDGNILNGHGVVDWEPLGVTVWQRYAKHETYLMEDEAIVCREKSVYPMGVPNALSAPQINRDAQE
jgi:hypothetical protein